MQSERALQLTSPHKPGAGIRILARCAVLMPSQLPVSAGYTAPWRPPDISPCTALFSCRRSSHGGDVQGPQLQFQGLPLDRARCDCLTVAPLSGCIHDSNTCMRMRPMPVRIYNEVCS